MCSTNRNIFASLSTSPNVLEKRPFRGPKREWEEKHNPVTALSISFKVRTGKAQTLKEAVKCMITGGILQAYFWEEDWLIIWAYVLASAATGAFIRALSIGALSTFL